MGQSHVHDPPTFVQPNHCNGEKDKEHMNDGVGAVFSPSDQKQALVVSQASPKGQSSQATEKAGLIGRANQPAGALGLLDRKRLELARALATQPSVLLFDEIGGGLTEAELHILVELISQLKSDGMTIIWIEHILHALLKVIDRLVCMSEGQVIAEGEPEAVMADESVMNAYLGGSELNA